jgi:hypothetical protein
MYILFILYSNYAYVMYVDYFGRLEQILQRSCMKVYIQDSYFCSFEDSNNFVSLICETNTAQRLPILYFFGGLIELTLAGL